MSSRVISVAALLLAAGVVAGCGSGGTDAADARSTAAASSSGSSSSTSDASPSTSPSPTDPTSASVAPATGTAYETETFAFTLPDDFTTDGGTSLSTLYQAPTLGTIVAAGQVPIGQPKTLDDAAETALGEYPGAQRQPDRTIDGQTVYVVTAPPDGAAQGFVYEIGRALDDRIVDLSFNSIPQFTSEADATQLRESVLATLTWK